MSLRPAAVPYEKLKNIRVILLDVDGILTDGKIHLGVTDDGRVIDSKSFHAHDGQGLIFASRMGFEIGLVTSRKSKLVQYRAAELGIPHVYQNVKEKWPVVRKILSDLGLKRGQMLYMGDDFPDLPVLINAGFSATVPEAPREIRERVDYITDLGGGCGAVREVLEMLFKANGKWNSLVSKYTGRKI